MKLLEKSLKDNIHTDVFRIKSQKILFNCLGQKGLYLISPTTNSIAVAAISFAHLEGLIHEGCQFVLKFLFADFTKRTWSRCSYCCHTTNTPQDQRSTAKEEWKLNCIPGIFEKERDTEKGQTIHVKCFLLYVFCYSQWPAFGPTFLSTSRKENCCMSTKTNDRKIIPIHREMRVAQIFAN